MNKLNCVALLTPYISGNYAALDVEAAHRRNDQLRLNFLREIFVNCDKIRSIVVYEHDPLDWILNSLGLLLKKVTSVPCGVEGCTIKFRISYL